MTSKLWLKPLGAGIQSRPPATISNASFDSILAFEQQLAKYTGAPYAIMTDCCTHAIELCMRYDSVVQTEFSPYTYISVPMTMHKLGINYTYNNEQWTGEYQFHGTRIWDSARLCKRSMYRPGMMQCLSFGNGKPLEAGHGGAILLDDQTAYKTMLKQRYDGRDLDQPWGSQKTISVGYHYKPSIEDAVHASHLLSANNLPHGQDDWKKYPDCRQITIEE